MFGGADVGIVDPQVLHDLHLLFVRATRWAPDVGSVKPELQKEWWLFRDELQRLLVTDPTDSRWPVKFVWEVKKENRSLVEELRKTISG